MKDLTKYKEIIMDYLSDGKIRQPSDFDRDVTGVRVNPFMMYSDPSDTPFGHALRALIDEKKVKAWYDDDGWKYQVVIKTLSPMGEKCESKE